MFSFFKKPTVNIHSVTLPDFGWQKTEDSDSAIKWISPNQHSVLSAHFFALRSDLPTVKDISVVRDFYRSQLQSTNGGLIEVNSIKIAGLPAIKCIFKISHQPGTIIYIASITIPFDNCSFVFKVQSTEAGITGMREAVITNKLLATGELNTNNGQIENWLADPYDSKISSGVLMNLSEAERYDIDFPDHPLTTARVMIGTIEKEAIFGSEISKLKLFI